MIDNTELSKISCIIELAYLNDNKPEFHEVKPKVLKSSNDINKSEVKYDTKNSNTSTDKKDKLMIHVPGKDNEPIKTMGGGILPTITKVGRKNGNLLAILYVRKMLNHFAKKPVDSRCVSLPSLSLPEESSVPLDPQSLTSGSGSLGATKGSGALRSSSTKPKGTGQGEGRLIPNTSKLLGTHDTLASVQMDNVRTDANISKSSADLSEFDTAMTIEGTVLKIPPLSPPLGEQSQEDVTEAHSLSELPANLLITEWQKALAKKQREYGKDKVIIGGVVFEIK
jgi:hypothetical protein